MNALKISKANAFKEEVATTESATGGNVYYSGYLLLATLLLIWPIAQGLIRNTDPTIGFIDPNIWLLLLMGLISFMIVIGLCWWLLQRFWMSLGLPAIGDMVLQFKELSVCRQLGFYLASFAVLLWTAVGLLTAIL